jgi:hypothetical protein
MDPKANAADLPPLFLFGQQGQNPGSFRRLKKAARFSWADG